MDKTIKLEKHQIEAWGLWWIQWQIQTKERLLKHSKSPKVFLDRHLVSSKCEGFSGNSATGLILPPK